VYLRVTLLAAHADYFPKRRFDRSLYKRHTLVLLVWKLNLDVWLRWTPVFGVTNYTLS